MDGSIPKAEAQHMREVQKSRRGGFSLFLLLLAFLLSLWGCDKKENLKQQAMMEVRKECEDILSMTAGRFENQALEAEYGMGSDWAFSGKRVETLYAKSFFFLLEVEATFTNKTNKQLKTIIRSKHSCSGVPPHLMFIERQYYLANDKTGEVKTTKEEVLEGGKLVLAPTKEDEFGDVLYVAIKDDRQLEEFLVKKGYLSPQKRSEFKRIQEESSKAALGQVLIEKGFFKADEWERIKQEYFAQKQKDALSPGEMDRFLKK